MDVFIYTKSMDAGGNQKETQEGSITLIKLSMRFNKRLQRSCGEKKLSSTIRRFASHRIKGNALKFFPTCWCYYVPQKLDGEWSSDEIDIY